MLGNNPSRAQACMRVQNRIIQHDVQSFCAECICIFFYDIMLERTAHHRVSRRIRVPDAEPAMMLGGKAAVGHSGRFCGLGPLAAVEFYRIEEVRRCIRVWPILVHIRRHIEMYEHAEAQIHETTLQDVKGRTLSEAETCPKTKYGQCRKCFLHISYSRIKSRISSHGTETWIAPMEYGAISYWL